MSSVLAFEALNETDIETLLKQAKQASTDKHRFLCAACNHLITLTVHRICQSGNHQHQFSNPFGIEFIIGCFAAAPGCVQLGPATDEHTWFPGFQWRIALCRNCQTHLGWGFQSSGEAFFGLILDRLVLVQ